MKLTNISCTQFAGARDQSIALSDGVNVIYGKNESGKSTLVNLLSRTLFQNVKLDRRSNKDFFELFFPAAKKGGSASGDFVDGKITFEAENGTYTLSKEWGTDARCTLSTPDGVIRDAETIKGILKDILVYNEGVYTDMLLTPQREAGASLKTLMDASQRTDAKREVVNAVSQAFAESDGIPVDSIEQAIRDKIDTIAGKHWDESAGAPVRRAERWVNGLGSILQTYYAWEDAKADQKELDGLETAADRAAAEYTEKDRKAKSAEEAYEAFRTCASLLEAQNERREKIGRLEKELASNQEKLSKWPALAENVDRAKRLETEAEERRLTDKFEQAKALRAGLEQKREKKAATKCPETKEITEAANAKKEIQALSNKLCAMNLTASVRMFNGHAAEIRSVRTGELLPVSECTEIREAVTITVPDVMEMTLAPADVDVDAIGQQIGKNKDILNGILEKYGVSDPDGLTELRMSAQKLESEIEEAENKLSDLLDGADFDTLEEAARGIDPLPRPEEMIRAEIDALCGGVGLSRFLGQNESTLNDYESEFGSADQLKIRTEAVSRELEKTKASAASTEDIPEEYQMISDPEAYLAKLKNAAEEARDCREKALNEKTAAASRLEALNRDRDDAEAAVERCRQAFEEQEEQLAHWRHIEKVFLKEKESLKTNPTQDIAENFARYLELISDGKVTSEFPDAEKLDPHVYSGDRLMDYDKLSEGTKETVSLAFRLAVLDHLFPEGGGLVVLDDPFANMDKERTEQAARIVKDCAERHQIVFLTCREEYAPLLGGNLIRI